MSPDGQHLWAVSGTVVRGRQAGCRPGYPTANLAVLPGIVLPGAARPAAISVGTNPASGTGERTLEAHLPGFAGDIYGELVEAIAGGVPPV